MIRRLRALIQHIRERARQENQRLDALVQQRTHELDRRNSDLRLVLDNVEQGLLTVDRNAVVSGERSLAIEAWLGAVASGDSLPALLERASPGKGEAFEVAWSQVSEGVMPARVSLEQLPRRLTVNARHLALDYKPLGDSENFERLLLVISDVTAEVERDRGEQEERDTLSASSRLFQDRAGALEFFTESQALLDRMREASDPIEFRRHLHTLKGNAALFGLSSLAALCHVAESELESSPNRGDQLPIIASHFQRVMTKLRGLLGGSKQRVLEVAESEYLALLAALHSNLDRETLRRMLHAWRLEPLRLRLGRCADQLTSLATRLGKGPVHVNVTVDNLYLAPEELSEFWSAFVHVVRNAVDHGLEFPDERRLRGKPGPARFELTAAIRQDRLLVELEDTGPGIDWRALRAHAASRGVPLRDDFDLEAALFADGISTRESPTELSGRGVGLSAVKAACERRHGTVRVETTLGVGTKFGFSWPLSELTSLVHIELGAQT